MVILTFHYSIHLQENIQNAEEKGVKMCVFSLDADMEDVSRLVRSLYTGKIDLCAKSVQKIIALCKMLQMETEMKFYMEVAKKFNEEASSIPDIDVKPVTPVYHVLDDTITAYKHDHDYGSTTGMVNDEVNMGPYQYFYLYFSICYIIYNVCVPTSIWKIIPL